MLIYSTDPESKLTIGSQAHMAFESGCKWIQLNMPQCSDAVQRKNYVDEVMRFCKGSDIILTIGNDSDLVMEPRVHGVHLDAASTPNAPVIRQQLGPHAIIGITSSSVCEIKELKLKADADYALLPLKSLEDAAKFIAELRAGSVTIPVVLRIESDTCVTNGLIHEILDSGANGLLYSSKSDNVGLEIQNILDATNSIKE